MLHDLSLCRRAYDIRGLETQAVKWYKEFVEITSDIWSTFKLTQTYSQIIPRKLVFYFLEIMSHEFSVEMSGNGTLGDNLSEAHILRIIVWVYKRDLMTWQSMFSLSFPYHCNSLFRHSRVRQSKIPERGPIMGFDCWKSVIRQEELRSSRDVLFFSSLVIANVILLRISSHSKIGLGYIMCSLKLDSTT